MDFAPYQSEEPSVARPALSSGGYPPAASSYVGSTRHSSSSSPPPPVYSPEPSASPYTGGPMYGGGPSTYVPPEDPANAMPVNQYETSMPLRLDWECVIAYLALPPVGSVVLLIFETKNDFVRFHGWQASLLFTPLFIVYIILSFSTVLSFIILAAYIIAALYLSYRVYRDSSNLERLELPVIGRLAADWVDSE